MDDAIRSWVARVGEGKDTLVDTSTGQAELEAALPALAEHGALIVARSPCGELSLSALIAQVTGHDDFGGQDDAVLELGFRRLTAPGRTILVVQVPRGISRSALRYLQHIRRLAPRLVLVVLGSTQLAALLAEPGFAALRARLQPAPEAAPAPTTTALVPVPVPVPVAVAVVAPPTVPTLRRARRPAIWVAAAAFGLAVLTGTALLVHGAPWTETLPARQAATAIAASPAQVPVPAVLLAQAPALAKAPLPALVKPAEPTPATMAAAVPAEPAFAASAPSVVAMLPPLLPPAEHGPAPRRPEPARPDLARADVSRLARSRPTWPPRAPETARYEVEPPPEPLPEWDHPAPRRRETPYLGTYAVDPYGMRVFRYDP